jgi:hypothetical protein
MFVSDRVQRPLHPRRERGVKLIVAMCGIGGGYPERLLNASRRLGLAARIQFDAGQIGGMPLV